jgi:hypothetical protein
MIKFKIQEGEEQVKRVLLMMKYDSSKTLTENVNEQKTNDIISQTTGGAIAGSVMGIPGAVVGALMGLVVSLKNFQNKESFQKLYDGCKKEKTKPTISQRQIDKIADDLNRSVSDLGTDEELIKTSFSSIPTIPDLCGVIKSYEQYHGNLYNDLFNDLGGDVEWKNYVILPLRKAIRSTEESSEKQPQKCEPPLVLNPKTGKCEKKDGGAASTPCPVGDINAVKKFQDWLDQNVSGWHDKYGTLKQDTNKGYGVCGPRTKKWWNEKQSEYKKSQSSTTTPKPEEKKPEQPTPEELPLANNEF